MHFSPKHPGGLSLSLAALGLAALIPTAARAQTQDLFVSKGDNTISRFAGTGPNTFSTTATTLSGGLNDPTGLAFDTTGNLFAANFGSGTLTRFAAGTTPGSFGTGIVVETGLNEPSGLVFDAHGDLFASSQVGSNSNGSITEFTAGATPGTFLSATTYTDPTLATPEGLAGDAQGDGFVANAGSDTIAEFTFNPVTGTFGTGKTVVSGLNIPMGLAFDTRGDLFAANYLGNSITEFTAGANPGTFRAGTTFATGLSNPVGLTVDAHGDLFAANNGSGTITEFAFNSVAGTFGTGNTIESNLIGPEFLAFSPTPAVPEASTPVSLGLLLTLGGLVIAEKKRKKA